MFNVRCMRVLWKRFRGRATCEFSVVEAYVADGL